MILKETVFASNKQLKTDEKDVNLRACNYSTYNTLRDVKSSEICPYKAFNNINKGEGDVMSRYHAVNGKISAR